MHITTNSTESATSVSRRRFLKQAAGASAVFAVPNIMTGPLFGAAAPSNRINVGQIGCGSIADYYHFNHLKQMDDVRVVATCDAFRSRGKAIAAKYSKHVSAWKTRFQRRLNNIKTNNRKSKGKHAWTFRYDAPRFASV